MKAVSEKTYHVWRAYIKHMRKQHPDKPLRWIFQHHNENPKKYEAFKNKQFV